jgi:hypothetical protein
MKVQTICIYGVALALLAVSCASAPPSQAALPVATSAPEWTTRTTFMEGPNIVFVLTGPENAKVSDLAYQAMSSYLDLPIGPLTPLVASQAVQKFLEDMSLTAPVDRYLKGGKGAWKVAVSKDVWDAARTKLKSIVDQSAGDPSVALEKAADELLRQGRYFDAISGYVAAASSAINDGKSTPRYRSNMAKANDVLDHITLSSTTPALVTRVGQPFDTVFDVKVAYGAGAQAPVVPGASVRFNFKEKKNGRIAQTGQTLKSDATGQVHFELPVPDFAVRDNLVVLVDVAPWTDLLSSVPKELRDSVSLLETQAAGQKLLLPYTVESAAKQVPMIVALADYDDKGSVQRRQETSSAIIAALQKEGFQAGGIPVNPTLLKSTNDNVILAAWRFQGKTTGRAVYGTVNLVSVTASGSRYSAEVSGTLKVADLGTGKGIFQLTTSKVATGSDKASATSLAYRQWAEDAVASMASDLP